MIIVVFPYIKASPTDTVSGLPPPFKVSVCTDGDSNIQKLQLQLLDDVLKNKGVKNTRTNIAN